jgi:uncharacterized protein (DUF924 family)
MRIFYVANHPGASRTQVWEHTPDGQVLIARVLGDHRPTTVRRAEARMFAAAPDMLDVLRAALHHVRARAGEDPSAGPCVTLIEQALLKATGQIETSTSTEGDV